MPRSTTYKAAACLLPGDKAGLLAPEIMAGIYQTTLRKIVRRRYNVFQGRVSLSVARKVGIALAHLCRPGWNPLITALQVLCTREIIADLLPTMM